MKTVSFREVLLTALVQVSDPLEFVPLISCMMATAHPDTAADVCLAELGITTTSPDQVAQCAASSEGAALLHDIGVETHGLDPALYFVPWLLYNDVRLRLNHASFSLQSLYHSRCLTRLSGRKAWWTSSEFYARVFWQILTNVSKD